MHQHDGFMKTILTILLLFPVLAFSQIVNIEEQRISGTNDSTAWYGYVRLGAKGKGGLYDMTSNKEVEFLHLHFYQVKSARVKQKPKVK